MKIEITRWNIEIKGVSVEILKHQREHQETPTWCYYLVIRKKKMADSFKKILFKGMIEFHRKYNLDFHGGISFYEKIRGEKGIYAVKVGCDYAHLWDEGNCYDYEDVLADAEQSVERFINEFPNYTEKKTLTK